MMDPLPIQIVRSLLNSRLPASIDEQESIEKIIDSMISSSSSPSILHIRVSIGHEECHARCSRSVPIEVWTITMDKYNEMISSSPSPPLPGHFLVNAIRSFVHFSQLSSWLRPPQSIDNISIDDTPRAASYDIVTTTYLMSPSDGIIGEHLFPMAIDNNKGNVRVNVRYVQRSQPFMPIGMCLQLGPIATDEWLLPSPLPSPSGIEVMIGSPTSLFQSASNQLIIGGKHKSTYEAQYSPDGPASKSALLDEGLMIESSREDKDDGIGSTWILSSPIIELKEESIGSISLIDKKNVMKKNIRRRLIGGWEESVLRGCLDGKSIQGYCINIVTCGSSSITLRLNMTTVMESEAMCVGRTTVAEEYRTTEGNESHRLIRKRGYSMPDRGQMQMTLMNGEGSARDVLVIPYDVRSLSPSSSTILRHRVTFSPKDNIQSKSDPLRYLIQFSISRDRSSRCFLSGKVIIIFATDMSVDGLNVEALNNHGVAHTIDRYGPHSYTEMSPSSSRLRYRI